jgi:hypothetical protein
MTEITTEDDAVEIAYKHLERYRSYDRSDADVKHVSTDTAGGLGITSCRVHFECGPTDEEVTVAMDSDGAFKPAQSHHIEP